MAVYDRRQYQRRDTAANWTSTNPTLAAGEIGFETDTGKFKIGDGTAWVSLAYATTSYTLPAATESVRGGVKAGYNLEIYETDKLRTVADTGRIGLYQWRAEAFSGGLATGQVVLNHDTPSSATEIIFRRAEFSTGLDKYSKVHLIKAGDEITIQGVTSTSSRIRFRVASGAQFLVISSENCVKFTVTFISQSGSEPADGSSVILEWNPGDTWETLPGKPSVFPPDTHNQAASTITSGTMDTARLGSGTANSTTFLRGDQTWAVPSGGSSSYTSGMFIDARDYSIVADGSTDNAPMLQAALDAIGAAGGGTLYIPGNTIATAYWIGSPVFMNYSNTRIRGSSKESTFITTRGPAFVFGLEPKRWSSPATYVDTDTSGTVNCRSGGFFNMTDGRYRTDVWEFTASGGYGAGPSGQPVLDFAVSPDVIYGFRGRGVCSGVFSAHPAATGCTKGGSSSFLGWEEQPVATFNVIYYAHDAKISGGIFGCGDIDIFGPDPWLLSGDGTDFIFDIAVTNDGLVDKVWQRFTFAQPATLGLHRVTVQVDFENGRLTAWVDRVQVATSTTNMVVSGFRNLGPSVIFNSYSRFARWETTDFKVGSQKRTVGELSPSATSDFTVVGCSVFTELLFNHSTTGSAQTRIDAAAITDTNTTMPSGGGSGVANTALTCLAIRTETGHYLETYTRGVNVGPGLVFPNGSANTIVYPALSDLTIIGNSNSAAGNGVSFGPFLDGEMNDVAIRNGFYNSIGSLDTYICYPLFVRNCDLKSKGSSAHLCNTISHFSNIKLAYIGRTSFRLIGTEFHLKGALAGEMDGYCEAFLVAFAGRSICAGVTVEDITINQEGARTAPRIAEFYVQKSLYIQNNRLVLRRVNCDATPDVPVVYLDEFDGTAASFYPAQVLVEDCNIPVVAQGVMVNGKDWRGTVNIERKSCFDHVTQITGDSFYGSSNVITVHKDFQSVPTVGAWIPDAHDVQMLRPAEGGVAKWRVKTGGTEGSNTPPVWVPAAMCETRTQHALSGQVFSTLHVRVSAPHPDLAAPLTLWNSFVAYDRATLVLERILTNAATFPRDDVKFTYDFGLPNSVSRTPDGSVSASAVIDNDTVLWNAAASGQKTNKIAVAMTSSSVEARPNIIARRVGFTFGVGTGYAYNFFCGKTEKTGPEFLLNANFNIPIDGIVIANSVRAGSWTTYQQNKVLDWLFGYPSTAFDATLYFGLSSTAIAADGTGGTELTGGSYARVSMTANSTNFGNLDEFNTTWINKTAITFPAPTADWGAAEWGFVADALTSGNILAAWPLNKPTLVKNGDQAPRYLPGTMHFQV